MYTHILFDLDGTITDSKEGITKSVQYALTKLGIIENDTENLLRFLGPPLGESFPRLYGFDEVKTKQALRYYHQRYEKVGMYELTVFPQIKDILEKLYQKKKKLFIATSKTKYFAEKIIKKLGLTGYFTLIAGANMDFTNAKKPAVIAQILTLFPQEPKHSFVMVGDREHDILGAHEHGIESIGVTYGYGKREEIEKAKPTHIAHSVTELLELLLKDNAQTMLF